MAESSWPERRPTADLVIVGAGIVGASCAYAAARAGLHAVVIDRAGVVAGTTGAGEGNILVSDKEPGPELDLALWSNRLWRDWGAQIGTGTIELERKGGLVVAAMRGEGEAGGGLDALTAFAAKQAAAGVAAEPVPAAALPGYEPHLAPGLPGGVYYPDDMQVQPMLAAAHLLRAAQRLGAQLRRDTEFRGLQVRHGRVTAARTSGGDIATGHVLNAAGVWGGDVAQRMATPVPVLPRRGFILVTEPLPAWIRHKVYTADYVANVASSDEGLETSTVVEGTRSGTVLIGASRERTGFDRTLSVPAVRRLAAQATALFPVLGGVRLIRAYCGFRPYCPDHLPVIGADPRAEGVLHACGHEGAGIGLAPATGTMIANLLTGAAGPVSPEPFTPARFAA
jgi:glycine/D-amino acid oxidase-like deaminating enzyme